MRGRTDGVEKSPHDSSSLAKAGSERTVTVPAALVKMACITARCAAVALGGPQMWDVSPGEPWRPPLDCSGGSCKPVSAAKLAAVHAVGDQLTSEGYL